MIGCSLSFCVRDIASGTVDISEVEKIVSSTNAPDEESQKELLKSYQKTYWRDFPNASQIAESLFDSGKIEQPRTMGRTAVALYSTPLWVQCEKEIVYVEN